MSDASSVDIIVAAHNAADTIVRAVRSALQQPQTRRVWLVDDGSSDDTASLAATIFAGEPRLDIRHLRKNGGPSAARNMALDSGNAEWVAVLDADDFFLEHRLENLLQRAAGFDFVADDLQASRDAGASWTPLRLVSDGELDFESFARGNLGRGGEIRRELGFLKPIMSRAFLNRHGLRYDEKLRLGEDYVLYAKALASGCKFATVASAGYVAVERPDSLSGQHRTADLESLYVAAREVEAASLLGVRERKAALLYSRSVRRKRDYRRVLDAKARGDYIGALATALYRPDTTLHILEDVVRTMRLAVGS